MPIYEYQCQACGHQLEALQKVSDAPLKKCPECGKPKLQKLISAPSFRLKGGGWYETDFKSDKEGKRNIADREEPAAKSEDSKSTDSKPASAGESAGKGASAAPTEAASKAAGAVSTGAEGRSSGASAGSGGSAIRP